MRPPLSTFPVVPLTRRRAWTVAIIATMVMSVSYVDRQALSALAPTVCAALAMNDEQYGWLVASFSFAYLFGAPVAGILLDKVGSRRGLVVSVVAWSAVAALHALVPSFAVFLVLRVALGFSEAPSFPGAAQSVRSVLPRDERSAGFGLLFTGSSIGGMVAVPLVIALNHACGWRVAFLLTAVAGLAWIPAWLSVASQPDVRAVLARGPAREDAPPPGRWSYRPVPPGEVPPTLLQLLFSAPVLRALMLVLFSAPGIMFGLNWFSKFLAHDYAISQDGLARFLWIPLVFFDLGAVGFGAAASRIDARSAERRTHAPLMVAAGALATCMAVVPLVHSPWIATALVSASLAGGGAIFGLLTADMLARVHPSHVSTAAGLTASAQSVAYVAAAPLVGRAFVATGSYDSALLALGTIVPAAVVAWCVWPVPRLATS